MILHDRTGRSAGKIRQDSTVQPLDLTKFSCEAFRARASLGDFSSWARHKWTGIWWRGARFAGRRRRFASDDRDFDRQPGFLMTRLHIERVAECNSAIRQIQNGGTSVMCKSLFEK